MQIERILNNGGVCGVEVRVDENLGFGLSVKFENGRHASVISGQYSYGGSKGLFEVLLDDKDEPVGYLTFEQVLKMLYTLSKKEAR